MDILSEVEMRNNGTTGGALNSVLRPSAHAKWTVFAIGLAEHFVGVCGMSTIGFG